MTTTNSDGFETTGKDLVVDVLLSGIQVPIKKKLAAKAEIARRFRVGASALLLATALPGMVGVAHAEKLPPLWGYGIKPCDQYLGAAEGEAEGVDLMVWEYRRYEDWLTGFISGLNLSTGKDVLQGADIDSAMRRIRAWCGGHEKDDFFTATMDFVRMLSALR